MVTGVNPKTAVGIGSWIPQVFYDLIARIISGIYVLGIFALSTNEYSQRYNILQHYFNSPKSSTSTFLLFIGVLVLSYIIAVFLLGLSEFTIFRKIISTRDTNEEVDFSLKYDFIKLYNPIIGNRITKLKAEIHMSKVLVVGSIIALPVNMLNSYFFWDPFYLFLSFFLLLQSVSFYLSGKYFSSRMEYAIENNAKLLDYEGWKWSSPVFLDSIDNKRMLERSASGQETESGKR
ncbi:MAG: hypothetical protein QNK37_27850 [Acidobacteriota bacterium]|nr:hypothetical protein [Acidobacteriota bacterium]